MKSRMILITLIALSTFGSLAQTVRTNFVTAAANLRVVNGRLYNIEKSTNWFELHGSCEEIISNGIVVVTDPTPAARQYRSDALTSHGNFLGESGRLNSMMDAPAAPNPLPADTRVFVTNFPPEKAVSIGGKVIGRVMKSGIMKTGQGEQLQVCDWGRPHIIAITITNRPVAGQTAAK